MAHLDLSQARQRPRRCRGSEHRPEAVGRMPIVAELVGVEGLGQAAADIVAEGDGSEKRRAVAPLTLGHGEGRRHNAAAWMRQRRRVGVVGFIGVGQHAVGQCGIPRGRNDIASNHTGFLDAAEDFDVGDRFFSGRQARPGNHGGDRVENMVFGLFDNRGGERPGQRRCYVGAQLAHDRRNRRLGLPVHEKKPI